MKIPINSDDDIKIIHKELRRLKYRKLPSRTSNHDNWIVFNGGYWWGAISDVGLSMDRTISISDLKEMK